MTESTMTTASPNDESADRIAVIGLSARFPGARNYREFWRNLHAGTDSISRFSDEELLAGGVDPASLKRPNYVKAGGVCGGTFEFDAPFFNYNPREAEMIDPQQRIFLEGCWEALEDAGYDPHTYEGRIGLFGGGGATQYLFQLVSNARVAQSINTLSLITSNDKDYLATRVGYKLNLRGPCVTVQTACSTSLVAVVLGCQSLLTFQSDIVLAGGVRTDYQEVRGYMYEEGGINSPDGVCRTFDAQAGGTVWGGGTGVIALKRYEDAVRDGDDIRAVVLGYGMNNDGKAKVGFTAPGVEGQSQVTSEALAMAGVSADSISYVECHGTATPIGDPIEIESLTRAFGAYTKRRQYCAVGSVKTNIGHTDSAAGAAGMIKTVLALQHRQIPASLNFSKPNPKIDFENSPFYVNAALTDWESPGQPRRAGVNSFGIGGTNAHVILQEAPRAAATGPSRKQQLLLLSAKSPPALSAMSANLAAYLVDREPKLADAAYTLKVGRARFSQRRAIVCDSLADAIAKLGDMSAPVVGDERSGTSVAFMFPGQGSQYANMGRELYEQEPAYRRTIDQCAALLEPRLGLDLRTLLYPAAGAEGDAAARLSQTAITQPAIFVVEYAMARFWMDWGVVPEAMIGHSIGEYVAACVAGVFSLEDALRLVADRGLLMQSLPAGSMLAVLLPEAEVRPMLDAYDGLCIAAVNNATTCVVAGPTPVIEAFEARLEGDGLGARRLHTSHAFHSSMMDPILADFRAVARQVTMNAPSVRFVSNVTGMWIAPRDACDPEYWVRHLRAAVRFGDGMATLLKDTACALLEVGPGRTLGGLLSAHRDRGVFASMPHPVSDRSATGMAFLLNTVGSLWTAGVDLDWQRFYGTESRRRVPLPTYPFQREVYKVANLDLPDPASAGPLVGVKHSMNDWFYFPSWKRTGPAAQRVPAEPKCWLLFRDGLGLGDRLAQRLRDLGQEVVAVDAGSAYGQSSARHFTLRPDAREDYTALFAQLKSSGIAPSEVVHLWAVTPRQDHAADLLNATDTLARVFYSPLHLVSELGEVAPDTPTTFTFISNDMHDVVDEPVHGPVKSTVIGPSRVIPREYENFMSRCVDVQVPADRDVPERTVDQLLAELSNATEDEVIAYRGDYRWIQTLEPQAVPAPTETVEIREQGVYLVTGAMGGIGGVFAEHLARAKRGRLIMVGRSAFPRHDDWDDWLRTHPVANSTSLKIRQYQAWEAEGAEIEIAIADVADLAQMQAVVARARQRFGAVHGVIHTAGVPGQGLMALKTPTVALEVLAPKVIGTLVLEEILKDEPLDFFVLCSSLTGYLGVHGQCDYVAANAFMDVFAHSRKGHGRASPVSIDWDRWDEVGMVVATTGAQASRDRRTEVQRRLQAVDDSYFFTHRFDEDGTHVYLGVLAAETHWPVGEHRLMGNATLVGTSYVELARAAFTDLHGVDRVDLQDVLFLTPLMLGDAKDREMNVVLRPAGDQYEFTVRSRSADADWQDHAVGRISASKQAATHHDLPALMARFESGRFTEEKPIEAPREYDDLVQAEERWDNMVGLAVLENEAVATIRLKDAYAGDVGQFGLHPAMMDAAIGFAVVFARRGGEYLPFAYNQVTYSRPMPQLIHSFARFKPASGPTDEFLSFDLIMTDDEGNEIIRVEGYGMKRVSEALLAQFGPGAEDRNSLTRALEFANSGECILSSEGVEVLQRTLSLLPTPQLAVSTLGLDYMVASTRPLRDYAEADQEAASEPVATHARPHLSTPFVAPRSDIETMIAQAWGSVLGLETIGVNDNFLDLGGHSLLATQVVARLRELFGANYSVASFYKNPTVAETAEAMLQLMVEDVDADTVNEILEQIDA